MFIVGISNILARRQWKRKEGRQKKGGRKERKMD